MVRGEIDVESDLSEVELSSDGRRMAGVENEATVDGGYDIARGQEQES